MSEDQIIFWVRVVSWVASVLVAYFAGRGRGWKLGYLAGVESVTMPDAADEDTAEFRVTEKRGGSQVFPRDRSRV